MSRVSGLYFLYVENNFKVKEKYQSSFLKIPACSASVTVYILFDPTRKTFAGYFQLKPAIFRCRIKILSYNGERFSTALRVGG